MFPGREFTWKAGEVVPAGIPRVLSETLKPATEVPPCTYRKEFVEAPAEEFT
jgi:hypothetical protein